MKISLILKDKGGHVYTIAPDASMGDALKSMLEHNIGSLVVLGPDGSLQGILSERDMLRAVDQHGEAWSKAQVSAAMTADVVTAKIDNKVDFAMDLMTTRRIRHLPILDNGKLAGMLSIGDIIKAQLNEIAFQNQMLKNYIKNWPEQG
jgi:CBS domain-containing protein